MSLLLLAAVGPLSRPAARSVVSLPTPRAIRAVIGPCIARWARAHGHPPQSVHRTIHRYTGRTVDLDRIWGEQTHAILVSLAAALAREAA